jgi:hypothetical protein
MQPGPFRPTSVTLLAVLAFILGALSVIIGLAGIALGLFIIVDFSSLGATIIVSLGTVVFSFGLLEIVYGVGFLGGKTWSWTLGLIVAVVSLLSSIFVIVGTIVLIDLEVTPITSPIDTIAVAELVIISFIAIIPIITSLVTIYGLTRQNVKAFFRKGPWPQT